MEPTIRQHVCHVDDLKNGQMREVQIGANHKALLSKINDKFYATGHLCSHFKAPLVKGSISSDGRVICPWHAACFDVTTGDIEEAPGLGSLQSYKVEILNETEVYVIAEEAKLANPFALGCQSPCKNDAGSSVVIIGGGAAGAIAAESMRKAGFEGKITIVSKEPHLPIDRIRLTKSIFTDPKELFLFPADYYETLNVNVLFGKAVVSVDARQDQVTLDDGAILNYSQLLLAMGGEPKTLPSLVGIEYENVFSMRTVKNMLVSKALLERIENPSVVILGSNFIGMEMAAALIKTTPKVTVIASEGVLFDKTFGPQIGTVFESLHQSNGVRIVNNANVIRVETCKTNPKLVRAVVLEGGETIEGDVFIIEVGARPQTDCIAGVIPLENDGSVLVNSSLQVVHHPKGNIFAAGDLVTFPLIDHATRKSHMVRLEQWSVASQHGRIAGYNMAMNSRGAQDKQLFKDYDTIPFLWTMQYGKSIRFVGAMPEGFSDIYVRGDLSQYMFEIFYQKDGKIIAVATMGMDPVASHCSLLLRKNKMPSIEEIQKGKSLLDISA